MSARSDRFERLRDNWSNLSMARIQLFARETARFSEEVIEEAISTVLVDCDFPPVLKNVWSACVAAERKLAARRPKQKAGYRPGDIGPDGRETFTPDGARAELKRLRSLHPEWFTRDTPLALSAPTNNAERRGALELMVSRIYVNGLRRCANLDGRAIIEAEQTHLF